MLRRGLPISVSKSVFLKIVGVLVIANNKATIKLFHNQGTLIIIKIITIIITWAGVGALLIANKKATIKLFHDQGTLIIIRIITSSPEPEWVLC